MYRRSLCVCGQSREYEQREKKKERGRRKEQKIYIFVQGRKPSLDFRFFVFKIVKLRFSCLNRCVLTGLKITETLEHPHRFLMGSWAPVLRPERIKEKVKWVYFDEPGLTSESVGVEFKLRVDH